MIRRSKPSKRRPAPLRIKLFRYLSSFFLFIILLLWIFQVVFMGNFYRAVTEFQIKRAAADLTKTALAGGDINESSYAAAAGTGVCVSVYRIKDGRGTQISEAHIRSSCFIHNFISGDFLNQLYSDTENAGGSLTTESEGDVGSLLYSKIVQGTGESYLILFNAEALPAAASAATVTVQLSLITMILIIGAAALAILLSHKITAPVASLCTESEKLAAGDYGVSFSGSDVFEINRLGETLRFAAAELEKSAKMQRELVANVTHDLRTPLTMIRGYSEVMRDIPGEMNAENIQVIIDESARLSALVNDVLDVTRAERGAYEPNLTEFSLTEATKKTVHRYSEMLREKGYTVSYESDGTDAIVRGDEVKITQALCNLLNNAVNFAGADKVIVVRQFVKDGACRTEVTDHGPGIPESELASIWDRYYRARDLQNKGVPGSGLGLTIVRQVMIMHNAKFGVRSTVGSGSTFWFALGVVR